MIHVKQDEYYSALSGNLDYFIDFMLEVIESTLVKYVEDLSYRAAWIVEELTVAEY